MQHVGTVAPLHHLEPEVVGTDRNQSWVHRVCAQPGQGLVGVHTPTPQTFIGGWFQQDVAVTYGLEFLHLPVRYSGDVRCRLLDLRLTVHLQASCPRFLLDLLDHLLLSRPTDSGDVHNPLQLERQSLLRAVVKSSGLLPKPREQGHRACCLRVGRPRNQREPKLPTLCNGFPEECAIHICPPVILKILEQVHSALANVASGTC
mmetsp:Transcript_65708/g.152656  ORF Transcript_65708/g.152656 Transcript_65708/m.152656 type:complete len:204 (+) Transcript_65708:609-1220(+)